MDNDNIFTGTVLTVICILSTCLAVFTGFNIYYYSQMKTDDTAGAVISSGTSSGMIVVNSLLCFVFSVITFWSIYRILYTTKAGAKALGVVGDGVVGALKRITAPVSSSGKDDVTLTDAEKKKFLEEGKNQKLKDLAQKQLIEEMHQLSDEASAIRMKIEKKNKELEDKILDLQTEANAANVHLGREPITYVRQVEKPKAVKDLECQLNTEKKKLEAKEAEIILLKAQKGGGNGGGGNSSNPSGSGGSSTFPEDKKIQYLEIKKDLDTYCAKMTGDALSNCNLLKGKIDSGIKENNFNKVKEAINKYYYGKVKLKDTIKALKNPTSSSSSVVPASTSVSPATRTT